ncbi:MAG: heavy metal-binding domain-containing protein, partial [Sediminibacterium sp.]|nr:heavy metal-binding domain-containing protein [Sediminibacterium sp.]
MEYYHHNQQRYTCPMHPEIVKNEPGSCPKCGMNLVPVDVKEKENSHSQHQLTDHIKEASSANEQHIAPVVEMQNTQGFQKYTCPMHPQIIQDGPGKCPLCGMSLVPIAKSTSHGGHEVHSSGITDFKKRFYVVLVLAVPIMLLSEMIQHWL